MGTRAHLIKDGTTGKRAWRKLGDSQALIPWFAALANRHNNRVDVGWLGDSLVEGYPVASWENTLQGHLRTLLQNRFPIMGTTYGKARGFVGVPSNAYLTTAPTSSASAFGWAFTGGTHDDAAGWGAKYSTWLATATGQKAILTLPNPVTSFDIKHIKGSAGGAAGGYSAVDGGAHVPFATNNATDLAATLHVATAANSTIEIGWNGTGGVFLDGIVEYDGNETVGFAVHNLGIGGAQVATWLTHHSPAGWPQSIAALNLDLLIIQLGGNEYLHAIGSATYQTNMTALIAIIRAAGITCPIVLMLPYDGTPLVGGGEQLQKYADAANAIAAADYSIMVVEHAPRMPNAGDAVTYNLFYTDQIHGAVDGNAYSFMSATTLAAISPQAA